eukprot:gnl/MRDRNA2_/MRDRNA2_70694_c0_seq1.p1 gnl/MRDRNA2_/MRDRNA2_70694_c0~~gnl/MRDRNA2_/MRDRNA2_70694_c0_seq1.p1  ORF type:complete len:136 (-),score=11.06 gnl/MRDRNA2_/MRDRNA2_70694_c0_seq1:13-420(-)
MLPHPKNVTFKDLLKIWVCNLPSPKPTIWIISSSYWVKDFVMKPSGFYVYEVNVIGLDDCQCCLLPSNVICWQARRMLPSDGPAHQKKCKSSLTLSFTCGALRLWPHHESPMRCFNGKTVILRKTGLQYDIEKAP